MSVFKSKGIILKIDKLNKNDFLYTIFSYDYGKIKANKKVAKKEKTIDIGYNINFELRSSKKSQIHKISNIKIVSLFDYNNKKFSLINSFLELVSYILKNVPDGVAIYEIYNTFKFINTNKNLSPEKILLAKLRIMNILGNLNIKHTDKITEKILNFVHLNNIREVLKLRDIPEKQKNYLENIS